MARTLTGAMDAELPSMRIGDLSRRTGLSPHTLRYYESLGLVKSHRGANNYRCYSEKDLAVFRLIHHCKRLGFTLTEIKGHMAPILQGRSTFQDLEAVIADKISRQEALIADLLDTTRLLRSMLEHCPRHQVVVDCLK